MKISVEKLLNETKIEVNVVAGQLDLVVALPGTVNWVEHLQWPGANEFRLSERKFIGVNNILEGYYKNYEKLTLFWVNRAGHSVAVDNTDAMNWILKEITNY